MKERNNTFLHKSSSVIYVTYRVGKKVCPRLRDPASGLGGDFTQPWTKFFGLLCSSSGTGHLIAYLTYRFLKDTVLIWEENDSRSHSGTLQLPWIAEFVVDCGWCSDVVNIFNEIDKGQVNPSVLAAHEDLLCCVAKVREAQSRHE